MQDIDTRLMTILPCRPMIRRSSAFASVLRALADFSSRRPGTPPILVLIRSFADFECGIQSCSLLQPGKGARLCEPVRFGNRP